jgi:hypothetical protein
MTVQGLRREQPVLVFPRPWAYNHDQRKNPCVNFPEIE